MQLMYDCIFPQKMQNERERERERERECESVCVWERERERNITKIIHITFLFIIHNNCDDKKHSL